MATIIKELIAKFTSDTSGLESGATKATFVVSNFSKAAAAATATAAAGFGLLATKQSHAGDELGKLTDKYGIGTEAISRFDHAASLAGVSTQGLANSFKFMGGTITDAMKGSEAAVNALSAVGLKAQDLINLAPEEAFKRIADGIASIENPTLRAQAAIDIFGRAGADMVPLLKDGAAGLAAASEQADRFGLTLSRVDASKLEAANDAVANIGAAANGAARQFAVGLAPAISTVADQLTGGVEAAIKFREAGAAIADTFIGTLAYISNLISEIKIKWWSFSEGFYRLSADMQRFNPFEDVESTNAQLKKADELMEKIANEQRKIEDRSNATGDSITSRYLAAENPESTRRASPINAELLKTLDRLNEKTGSAKKSMDDLSDAGQQASKSINSGFLVAGKTVDEFKVSSASAISQISSQLSTLFGNAFGGTTFGRKAGGILGDLAGSVLGSVVSGTFMGGSGFDLSTGINWNANGGVISGRSIFPSSGGMQGAGEMGEEGILPLKRINGKLGVSTDGMGGGITQIINVEAGVSQTVRAEMMRLLPAIEKSAVRAVSDANKRGKSP